MSARLPLALVVWIAAVAAAIALSSSVAGSIHTTTSAGGSGSSSGSSSVDPSSVRTPDSASLMHIGPFTQALATLRSHLGTHARLQNFVLYPGYVSVTAVRGTTELDAADYVNGNYAQTTSDTFPGNDPVFPLSKIDPRIPAVLSDRLTRVAHVPPRQIRYMVATPDPVTHRFTWSAYLFPGSRYEYLSAPGGTGPLSAYAPGGSLRVLRG